MAKLVHGMGSIAVADSGKRRRRDRSVSGLRKRQGRFHSGVAILRRKAPLQDGEGGLPPEWRGQSTIQKPFTEAAVRDALMAAMGVENV